MSDDRPTDPLPDAVILEPVVAAPPPVSVHPEPVTLQPEPGPLRGSNSIASLLPFGLGLDKPHAWLDGARALWENRDELSYTWQILSKGVCGGCSLGPRGLRDDVMEGIHLCTRRLQGLRLHTTHTLAPADLLDMDRLRRKTNHGLQALGRLPFPFVYRPGDRGFRRIGWEEAYSVAALALQGVPPERMGFIATHRSLSNEGAYALGKAARLLGTHHVDSSARQAEAATMSALQRSIGVGAATCSLQDILSTDLLLIVGTGFVDEQPGMMRYLREAKDRGSRVVVLSSRWEQRLDTWWEPSSPASALFGTRLQDDFVQVRGGGEAAFLCALQKALIARNAEDKGFVLRHTVGWEQTRARIEEQSWAELERLAAVHRRDIDWVAELFIRARTVVTLLSPGPGGRALSPETISAIANLHLSRGLIGKPGCGILPLGRHPAALGAEDCGLGPDILPGRRPLNRESAATLSAHWGGQPLPTGTGMGEAQMMEAAREGGLDLLYLLGGDPTHLVADSLVARPTTLPPAVGRLRLRVHQDTWMNRDMLLDPGETVLLLPAQTIYEQRGGGTTTSVERRIRFSPEIPGHPVHPECRPEYEIPCQFVSALKPAVAPALRYADASAIRAEMEQTMPLYSGIAALQQAGDALQWGGPALCADAQFTGMPDQRARFIPIDLPLVP